MIAETFHGLESMPEAHRLMESNTHTGKIVVRLGSCGVGGG
ncbi:zinc-binding dehydrogenase [Streptomyces sp. NPDC006627]